MKTKKFYAVEVSDNTCNVPGHESGIYGKGDYSWMTESLNGGNGEYNMTKEEAIRVMEDFQLVIERENLEWASVDIDSVEVPVAETMQDVADYYNEADCIDVPALEAMIKANGWVSDCGTEFGVCHSDKEKVIINDNGEAVVVSFRTTLRQKAIEFVNNMTDEELDRLIVMGHDTHSQKWMEVYPNGNVHETEEADNNTSHYISYPDKEVAGIYEIHSQCAEACNCDVCVMYRWFENEDKEDFIERYSEDDWNYCNENTLHDAILDCEHDNGNYADGIREQMIAAIEDIEHGYFDDEI